MNRERLNRLLGSIQVFFKVWFQFGLGVKGAVQFGLNDLAVQGCHLFIFLNIFLNIILNFKPNSTILGKIFTILKNRIGKFEV